MGVLIKHFRAACDLLMPRRCCVCGCELVTCEQTVCLSCLSNLPLTWYWAMSPNDMADRLNSFITDIPLSYMNAAALFFFEKGSPYRNVCYSLKYGRDIASGKFFAGMLAERLRASEFFADIDIVVPVPLHWTRRLSRGYNQAEIIASVVADCLSAELVPDMLYRRRRTHTQTELSVADKMENVRNAFAVRRRVCSRFLSTLSESRRLKILIVDDVFTTGATIFNCFKALHDYFGESAVISAATLAAVKSTSSRCGTGRGR